MDRPAFVTEQGHWMGRPGIVDIKAVAPRNDIETVKVRRSAVTALRGELIL